MLTNIHNSPTAVNLCNNKRKAMKSLIVIDYSCHLGYMGKEDRIANSYSICHQTWKWTEKLFFSLLDLAILNSCILLSLCGRKIILHKDFQFTLVRNMLAQADMNEVDQGS